MHHLWQVLRLRHRQAKMWAGESVKLKLSTLMNWQTPMCSLKTLKGYVARIWVCKDVSVNFYNWWQKNKLVFSNFARLYGLKLLDLYLFRNFLRLTLASWCFRCIQGRRNTYALTVASLTSQSVTLSHIGNGTTPLIMTAPDSHFHPLSGFKLFRHHRHFWYI